MLSINVLYRAGRHDVGRGRAVGKHHCRVQVAGEDLGTVRRPSFTNLHRLESGGTDSR